MKSLQNPKIFPRPPPFPQVVPLPGPRGRQLQLRRRPAGPGRPLAQQPGAAGGDAAEDDGEDRLGQGETVGNGIIYIQCGGPQDSVQLIYNYNN